MIPMRTNQDSIGMLKMGFEGIFCELILADILCDLGAKLTGGSCQMAEENRKVTVKKDSDEHMNKG